MVCSWERKLEPWYVRDLGRNDSPGLLRGASISQASIHFLVLSFLRSLVHPMAPGHLLSCQMLSSTAQAISGRPFVKQNLAWTGPWMDSCIPQAEVTYEHVCSCPPSPL